MMIRFYELSKGISAGQLIFKAGDSGRLAHPAQKKHVHIAIKDQTLS
jgi:hypothetical protein